MTREELKRHCLKQIESCEMWASHRKEEPHGKIYEEHKLILELLEQEDILDKIRTEIKQAADKQFQIAIDVSDSNNRYVHIQMGDAYKHSLNIIDKYRAESEAK